MNNWKEILPVMLVCGVVLFVLVYAFMIGLDKELARQEAQTQYMCEYYGHAINKHYGHEVCLTEE